MRSLTKSLVGGVLATLLILSASPAQAFNFNDTTPDAEVAAPNGDTSADALDSTDVIDEADASNDADGVEGNGDVDGTEDVDGVDGSGDLDGVDDVDGVEAPELEELLVGGDEADEAEAEPVAADQTPVVEAPTSIDVTGTVMIVPDEAGAVTLDDLQNGVEPEVSAGATMIAADGLGFIPVDASAVEGVEPGAIFSGSVELSGDMIDAVDERIAADGAITASEVAEIAQGVAADLETPLVAEGTATNEAATDNIAGASAKKHNVEIVNFGGSYRAGATETQLRNIIGTASTYWKNQTNGQISSMPVSKYKSVSTKLDLCMNPNYDARLWTAAAKAMGVSNFNNYGKSGRHLVVFVNANCAGAVGWGTLGTLHGGGITWVNLGSRPADKASSDLTHTTAHELGHNMGLGHGDARLCSSPYSDGPTSGSKGTPTGVNGCYDYEYGDFWDVMGIYLSGYGSKPPALAISQKKMLNATTSATLKNVKPSGGAEQTFTLSGAGLTSGLLGLRVESPSPGGTVFVEYRNGKSQDSGMPFAGGTQYSIGGLAAGTGVKVMKGYNAGAQNGGKRSAALTNWATGQRMLTARQGTTIKTNGDTARIYVQSAGSNSTASTAKVRVQYKGFKDGGKTVSTVANGSGALVPGKKLTAKVSGAWKVTYGGVPKNTKIKYQWYRNGTAIKGSTSKSYTTKFSDVGKKITVRITPSASGYVSGKGSTATSKQVSSPAFYDVSYSHKFYKEIYWMKSSGLSTGVMKKGKAYYQPKGNVSREAMAAFLYRLSTPAGATAPTGYKIPKKSPFKDVSTKHKFYKEIAWMYESGLSTGIKTSKGRMYSPKSSVTREAMAAFLYRADGATYGGATTSQFADVKKGQKFYKEITWMYKTGLSTGVKQKSGKPKYESKKSVSREAMAAFLYRLEH